MQAATDDSALRGQATSNLHEHRSGGLNDHELESVADRIWERMERRFENLGWDMSTPAARDRIRDNNRWVNEWRTSADRAKSVAANAGILAFVSGLLVLIWQAFKIAVAKIPAAGG